MKRAIIVFGLIGIICLAFIVLAAFRRPQQFDQIETNAKRVITGSELQAWATNLMEKYPTNVNLRVSELGTNFPSKLLKIYHHPPDIWVYEAALDSPGFVRISWGGGLIGNAGFEIGPTSFASASHSNHYWQPGVYFFTKP